MIHLEKYNPNSNVELQQEVLSRLSSNLQEELRFQVNQKIYERLTFLRKYFTDKVIRQTISITEEVSILPGSYIYNQQSVSSEQELDNNLYLILKGEGTPHSL